MEQAVDLCKCKNRVYRPDSIPAERLKYIDYFSDLSYCDIVKNEIENGDITKNGKKPAYVSEFMTYDTETTSVSRETLWNDSGTDVGFTYLHQFYFRGNCLILRENYDVKLFFETIADYLQKVNKCLVIYVHNLSFEFQFLKSLIHFTDVFVTQKRKILKATAYDCIEFRCSYMLSNMSLEKFTENYCDERYRKDKELIDYEILRYPWTELDSELLYYALMDVITLHKAIENLMEREDDNIKSIPVTSTGYVRRSYREACLGKNTKSPKKADKSYNQYKTYRKKFLKTKLTLDQYNLCVQAFRGGDTHASRFHAGIKLDNVGSYDFASSYPAAIICSGEFPIGGLRDCTENVQTKENLMWYASNFWLIVKIVFCDLELRNPYGTPVPYIPVAKIKREKKNGLYDNGRVISQPGFSEFVCLGIELPLIFEQYQGKMKIAQAFCTTKGYLPDEIRKTCYFWYKKKTELKEVEGREYEYMKSKNRVNASFGMCVEKIIKEITEFDENTGEITQRKPTQEEAEDQLSKYYSQMSQKFLAYQWGITITAVCRLRLHQMIAIVGHDFVYCDTDSCKMLHPEKYELAFKKYNESWIKYAEKAKCDFIAYTKNGEKQILGFADREKDYKFFKTLGAKKYAYIDSNNKLNITIAGVPKKIGAKLLGNIDNFKEGFIFSVSDSADNELRQEWKKQLTYNDDMNLTYTIDGHKLNIKSNVAILRTTYELDLTDDYKSIIEKYNSEYVQDYLY